MKKFLISLVIPVGFFLFPPAFASAQTVYSLQDAVKMALSENTAIKGGEAEIEEATALKASARGRFGPVLKADASYIRWNDEFRIDPNDLFDINPNYRGLVELMMGPLSPITAREQTTKQLTFQAVQPITPLYAVYQGYKARSYGEDATRQKFENTRQEIAYKTMEAYFRYLKAKEMKGIAEKAEQTIKAHIEQAKNFERAEFIGKNEILTAEVELANIQELLIRATSGTALARAALANLIGLSVDVDFDVAPVSADDMLPFETAMPEAQEKAVSGRHDLDALRNKTNALTSASKAAVWQLTPTIAAVGQWQRSEGIPLVKEDEYFVGAVLKWDFWDWGKTYYEACAAQALARQSRIKEQEASNLIRLQVKQSFLEFDSARQRMAAMKKAVEQANENLRIQQLRFDQGLGTSVDVLDAQTLLTKTQGNFVAARCDALTAKAMLRQVIGQDLAANP